MKILIQSKTLKITEALRAFVERQVLKVSKPGQRVDRVSVFLENVGRKKNDLQSATAKIKVSVPGQDLIVQRRARDMYQAVTEATASAVRHLRKTKERRLDQHRHWRLRKSAERVLPPAQVAWYG